MANLLSRCRGNARGSVAPIERAVGLRTLRFTGRGLETSLRRTHTSTKLETADTAKGSLRSTAPVLDPTRFIPAHPRFLCSPPSPLLTSLPGNFH
jgi:hypothetical protein